MSSTPARRSHRLAAVYGVGAAVIVTVGVLVAAGLFYAGSPLLAVLALAAALGVFYLAQNAAFRHSRTAEHAPADEAPAADTGRSPARVIGSAYVDLPVLTRPPERPAGAARETDPAPHRNRATHPAYGRHDIEQPTRTGLRAVVPAQRNGSHR